MKIISKPWGHENWIEVTNRYVIKHLVIKPGFRSSLQFHKKKCETFILLQGRIEIELKSRQRFKKVKLYPCLTIKQHKQLRKAPAARPTYLTLLPKTKHRIINIGKKNAVILEISSPELRDIVRLEDDFGRAK